MANEFVKITNISSNAYLQYVCMSTRIDELENFLLCDFELRLICSIVTKIPETIIYVD